MNFFKVIKLFGFLLGLGFWGFCALRLFLGIFDMFGWHLFLRKGLFLVGLLFWLDFRKTDISHAWVKGKLHLLALLMNFTRSLAFRLRTTEGETSSWVWGVVLNLR